MKRIFLFSAGILAMVSTIAQAQSQDPFKPTEHFKIERPAALQSDDANEIYASIIKQMAEGYAQSGDPTAKDYLGWRRDNTAPYLSGGHGNRFLNNYGNKISQDYLALKRGEKMPVGSILAKDSFTVTQEKEIFAGALFLMEKLPAGTNSVFGDSELAGDETMQFCHDCHVRVKKRDYLYLIPRKYRAGN